MNELIQESSPYLLQHANNPIYWKAWNQSTLQQALDNQQLIIISIGYSTCHWCHVMEHESFEDKEVAQIMNAHFVSIKIDREEFPDVDAHYMKAVQLMTKQGGWPLNVVCLPDGRPIWGGTYFTKDNWINSLTQLHTLFTENKEATVEFATKLHEGITIMGYAPQRDESARYNLSILLDKWSKSFDYEYGGYTRAPKFMMPTNLYFLQLQALLTQNKEIQHYIDTTLTQMAWGGIFDPIEGGFSRYSVDFKWHIPHFEKMLYDNAQLLSVYAKAYTRTQLPLYKEVIEKTIAFITNNWSNAKGGYYSALDADSLNQNNELKEGAFYVWTKEELQTILQGDFDLFSTVFNINSTGYWEENNYVLYQNQTLEKIAKINNLSLEELQHKKINWEKTLQEVRSKRAAPRLDTKTITSWNMMYAIGLLDAYAALQDETHLEKALAIVKFIQQGAYTEEQGLFRIFNNNKHQIVGCLDDYAYYIETLIKLFEHTGEHSYLYEAKNNLDLTFDLFFDDTSGFFFYSQSTTSTISKQIEIEDNVIPSSNAIMAINLLKLGTLFENTHYTKIAEAMTKTVLSQIDYPSAYSHWLIANTYIESPRELSIVGQNALVDVTEVQAKTASHLFIIPVTKNSNIPYLAKYTVTAQSQYYLCIDKTCHAPIGKEEFTIANKLL